MTAKSLHIIRLLIAGFVLEHQRQGNKELILCTSLCVTLEEGNGQKSMRRHGWFAMRQDSLLRLHHISPIEPLNIPSFPSSLVKLSAVDGISTSIRSKQGLLQGKIRRRRPHISKTSTRSSLCELEQQTPNKTIINIHYVIFFRERAIPGSTTAIWSVTNMEFTSTWQ